MDYSGIQGHSWVQLPAKLCSKLDSAICVQLLSFLAAVLMPQHQARLPLIEYALCWSSTGLPLNDSFTGLFNVSCSGNETSIKYCPSGTWSNGTSCPSNYSATLNCMGKNSYFFISALLLLVYLFDIVTRRYFSVYKNCSYNMIVNSDVSRGRFVG